MSWTHILCDKCKFPLCYCACNKPKDKLCKFCGKTYPHTSEFFHWWNKSFNRLHVYCKSCKINYVMAWKHGKPFIKLQRKIGVLRKERLVKAGEAIRLFLSSSISTEELIVKIRPLYKEGTDSVVKGLRRRLGL